MIRTLTHLAVLVFTILVWGCSGGSGDRAESIKLKQYYIKGEQLYIAHCSNCHQKDGQGLGRVYPPIANSDFVRANPDTIICIIRSGLEGEVTVNGIMYNMAMPPIPTLTDLEIAQITTYILNSWDYRKGLVDVKTTSARLERCR